ncbi:formylglycine-generating enzyme family protein [Flavobacterium psychrotolerans]|uniref:Sulfatase-modifying factor enzyme-like domain-containing protein n=1 Tax=Flavobacterium psychrotolerans TaxID=2169410 RepID=A0A2U1JMM9_9FLAO|nr:SUMF1/EgtB/PvdO family nonheme iron enzyme [Flavobacterium psychrotolerans]PWA06420.1 hypothetical protein DB895_03080 [Flavobacterium psychrotolerans]
MKNQFSYALLLLLFVVNGMQSQGLHEMITIPAGTFLMGDNSPEGEKDEQPIHMVSLSSFSIADKETSVKQWKSFCTETRKKMPMTPEWGWDDNNPIVNITWEEAVSYTEWLSDKTGRNFRLPTEAEWEYAAKGGILARGYKYSGGKSLELVGWGKANSEGRTNAVGTKMPNEIGLYDMSGNTYEWCFDWYSDYSDGNQTNPVVTEPVAKKCHIIRGGSWRDVAQFSRVSNRYFSAVSKGNYIGFRVVRTE